MSQIHPRYISSSLATKSRRCSKVKCRRPLPLNHPVTYTNGLCEKHFFSIDLPSSDEDENNNLSNESKLLSKENESIKKPSQPSRGDIRKTREIFDGHQWCIIEQTIDCVSSSSDNDSFHLTTIKNNTEENLLQIFRLLSNYQTVKDELKKQHQDN